MSKSRSELSRRICVLTLLLMAGLLFASCRPDQPRDQVTTNETTNNAIANNRQANQGEEPKTAASQLRRYLANVWARTEAGGSPSMLNDDTWHAVKEGARVRTDEQGEGWLRVRDCMTVYVFQKSEMMIAPCSKSEYTSGSINCQLAGTSVYNNSCESRVKQIIETPTAEVTLEGTWVSVTYLPARQLTLTMVFQGQASIRPVLAIEGRRLGEPVVVKESQFWLSVPDDRRGAISGLPTAADARQPQGFDRLPTLLDALGMNEWRDRIWKRAAKDKINAPTLAPPEETRRTEEEAAKLIDCDCQRAQPFLIAGSYVNQCLRTQQALRQRYIKTGKIEGTCDPRTSGPKARPAATRPPKNQLDDTRVNTTVNRRRTQTQIRADNSNQLTGNRAVNGKPPR
jgi:hypothetical protein